MSEPISLSAVYACRDPAIADARSAADPPLPNYGRDGTPNVRALERAVAELEGADDAHAVASGMAAIALTALTHLAAGRHVVASADCYGDARRLLADELSRFGVRCTLVDMTDRAAVDGAVAADTAMIYAETIANPSMKLTDVAALAETARRRGALLCIDNTFATPALCQPLRHGADLVVHSATKFLGGHHDLTAGVVAGRGDLIAAIRRCSQLYGPTLGPVDAWLALRGIRTLA
ncbi:MAG TPA: PLP-dependent transferase, partial [Thermomicrobiales bacterium]|nr:PLP-dependent transferase [Thermomicrobiales bacterium]